MSADDKKATKKKNKKRFSEIAGFKGKTIWDWFRLLIVPVIISFVGLWFTISQRNTEFKAQKTQREADNKAQQFQRQEELVQNYLDKITDLIAEKELVVTELDDPIREIARARTLTVLRLLDSERKGIIFQFLSEAGLVSGSNPVISLRLANLKGVTVVWAELQGADLSYANLEGAFLYETDLEEANLRRANLKGTWLQGANLSKAILEHAYLGGANLEYANLEGADLTYAYLSDTNLVGAQLQGADLREATLEGAQLQGADLRGAIVNDAQLQSAKSTKGMIMPDGTKVD